MLKGIAPGSTSLRYVTAYVEIGDKKYPVFEKVSFNFETPAGPAPENLAISNITRKSAKLTFSPLPEKYLKDIDASNIDYIIYIKNLSDSSAKERSVYCDSTCTKELTDLLPGTKYQITVRYHTAKDKNELSKPVEFKTKDPLKAPAVTFEEVATSDEFKPTICANYEKSGDDTGNMIYGIEYKLFQKTSYYNSSTRDEKKYSAGKVSVTVNGGNTYKVRLYCYEEGNKNEKAYSEEQTISLKKIADSKFYKMLINTSTGASAEISSLDIVLNGLTSSTGTTYNFLIQPVKTGTFKYDLSSVLSSASSSIAMVVVDSSTTKSLRSGTTYNPKFTPITGDIYTYGNYLVNGKSLSSTYIRFMGSSIYNSTNGTWTSAPGKLSSLYKTTVYESDIYNNSLYVYYSVATEGDIAFSFIY